LVIDFNKEGTAMLEDGHRREGRLARREHAPRRRFLRASLKGWEFCRDSAAQCVEIVLKESPSSAESTRRG